MENLLRVGVISQTHGIRGEVKVYPTTDDAKRFKKLKSLYIETKHQNIEVEIESVKFFKQFVILKFKNIDNINDIEKYKNCNLLITRENAFKLAPNENFICDLVGCRIISDEDVEIGELVDVMLTGANDVYVVKTPDEREVLLPVIKDCVLDVDIDNKVIKVHILPGLLEIYE